MEIKKEIEKIIIEAEHKIEYLPESYFISYFKQDFLKKIKEIIKKIN